MVPERFAVDFLAILQLAPCEYDYFGKRMSVIYHLIHAALRPLFMASLKSKLPFNLNNANLVWRMPRQPVSSGRMVSIFIEMISFEVLEIWVPNKGEGLNSGTGFPLKLLEVKQFTFNCLNILSLQENL